MDDLYLSPPRQGEGLIKGQNRVIHVKNYTIDKILKEPLLKKISSYMESTGGLITNLITWYPTITALTGAAIGFPIQQLSNYIKGIFTSHFPFLEEDEFLLSLRSSYNTNVREMAGVSAGVTAGTEVTLDEKMEVQTEFVLGYLTINKLGKNCLDHLNKMLSDLDSDAQKNIQVAYLEQMGYLVLLNNDEDAQQKKLQRAEDLKTYRIEQLREVEQQVSVLLEISSNPAAKKAAIQGLVSKRKNAKKVKSPSSSSSGESPSSTSSGESPVTTVGSPVTTVGSPDTTVGSLDTTVGLPSLLELGGEVEEGLDEVRDHRLLKSFTLHVKGVKEYLRYNGIRVIKNGTEITHETADMYMKGYASTKLFTGNPLTKYMKKLAAPKGVKWAYNKFKAEIGEFLDDILEKDKELYQMQLQEAWDNGDKTSLDFGLKFELTKTSDDSCILKVLFIKGGDPLIKEEALSVEAAAVLKSERTEATEDTEVTEDQSTEIQGAENRVEMAKRAVEDSVKKNELRIVDFTLSQDISLYMEITDMINSPSLDDHLKEEALGLPSYRDYEELLKNSGQDLLNEIISPALDDDENFYDVLSHGEEVAGGYIKTKRKTRKRKTRKRKTNIRKTRKRKTNIRKTRKRKTKKRGLSKKRKLSKGRRLSKKTKRRRN